MQPGVIVSVLGIGNRLLYADDYSRRFLPPIALMLAVFPQGLASPHGCRRACGISHGPHRAQRPRHRDGRDEHEGADREKGSLAGW